MHLQSFLDQNCSPLQALFLHFNVKPTPYEGTGPVGETFDMQVLRDAHMPTHVLAVLQSGPAGNQVQTAKPPTMLPIDATRFDQGFRIDLGIPLAPPGTPSPVPFTSPTTGALMVTLPVVHVTVPHIASLPLLLLFAMQLETQYTLLSFNLLPVSVVEEFPNAPAMSSILARCPEDKFDRYYYHNQGIWKNILSLGVNDNNIYNVVQTAWNVTADARRLRARHR
ncbi:hypothetical protein CVT24_012125 [Panaeolus cyanescens]|uniref:Uncharacterized protein n=1 Tax=Panaeolus cyanescens TaxID=181874 RepID=A0A409YYS7_9AGAR|nr:hypothetical protein CVT24_012125 [Panaeolus cyanescens]